MFDDIGDDDETYDSARLYCTQPPTPSCKCTYPCASHTSNESTNFRVPQLRPSRDPARRRGPPPILAWGRYRRRVAEKLIDGGRSGRYRCIVPLRIGILRGFEMRRRLYRPIRRGRLAEGRRVRCYRWIRRKRRRRRRRILQLLRLQLRTNVVQRHLYRRFDRTQHRSEADTPEDERAG